MLSGWHRWAQRLGITATAGLLGCWLFSLCDGWSAAADTELTRRFAPPLEDAAGWGAPLGRDAYGRDLLRVLIHGTQAFVGPGLGASCVALGLGLGAAMLRPLPGQHLPGERVLVLGSRALPVLGWLLLVSVLSSSLGSPHPVVWLAFAQGLLMAPEVAQQLRWRVNALVERGVLEGARAQGLKWRRVRWHWLMRREALPLAARTVPQVLSSFLVVEAALSYLGDFGVLEPTPSWGRLLRDLSPLLFRAEPGAPLWLAGLLPALFWGTVQALERTGTALEAWLEGEGRAPVLSGMNRAMGAGSPPAPPAATHLEERLY